VHHYVSGPTWLSGLHRWRPTLITVASILVLTNLFIWGWRWLNCKENELPIQLVGKVIDLQTAGPVEGASVYIKTSSGVDITEPGGFSTDSRGIFIINAQQPPHWGDKLVFYGKNCQSSQEIVLSNKLQLAQQYRPGEYTSIPIMLNIKLASCRADQTAPEAK